MSKHIIDSARLRSDSTKSEQYARIYSAERLSPQSKLLQRRPQDTNLQVRAKRFLEIERRNGQQIGFGDKVGRIETLTLGPESQR
jgi:hypothetical protein